VLAGPLAITCLTGAILGQASISPFQQLSLTDRNLQANGVEMLVKGCDGCTPHLLGIWRTTERFDVRDHIALVLERLGPEGLPALIELTRELNVATDDGQRNLIVRALTPSGPAALEALTTEILEHQPNHSIVFLLPLAEATKVDPAPFARTILSSSSAEARAQAIRTVAACLPIDERSRLVTRTLLSPDAEIRSAATTHGALPEWTDAERTTLPDEYQRYVDALITALSDSHDSVVRAAAEAIRANGHTPSDALPALRTLLGDASRTSMTRTAAMRALIAVYPDRPAAVAEIGALIDTIPIEVCTALTDVAPCEIPNTLIPHLVSALKPARGREETLAADLLVRIGPRAVAPLTDSLAGTDADLSALAAETLGRIGPSASAAIDPLIAQLKSRGTGWQGEMYARALIAIGGETQRAREALGALIRRTSQDPMDLYASGTTLRELMRANPDSLWVRSLADPVVRDHNHPLREWVITESTDTESAETPREPRPTVIELTDQISFGEGDAPSLAMAALGRTRPITPEILELIRAHFDDLRSSMRSAAFSAAGSARGGALPLLDELLDRGRAALHTGAAYDIAEAVERIAPGDQRVMAFLAEYRAARGLPRIDFPR